MTRIWRIHADFSVFIRDLFSIAPRGAVSRLLVRDGGLLRAVEFHQDEVGGVGVVLEDVETDDAWLLHAGSLCRERPML